MALSTTPLAKAEVEMIEDLPTHNGTIKPILRQNAIQVKLLNIFRDFKNY